jgi:hypothetical protein
LICLIWRIINIGVRPPGMSFADKAGGTGDFSTIQMQPHHHVERVTRILWWSLRYLKCILRLSFVCFEREIPSV